MDWPQIRTRLRHLPITERLKVLDALLKTTPVLVRDLSGHLAQVDMDSAQVDGMTLQMTLKECWCDECAEAAP